MKPINIRICGFGGQGIVLSAIVLGTAAVTKRGLYAVQTQSYGSEARGGQCQAELIVSDSPINSPATQNKDILVAMFQSALDAYLPSLKPNGILIVDPAMVTDLHNTTARVYSVPATETAVKLGNRICANMVMLGYFQEATGLITRDDVVETMKELVPERFHELNERAIDAGVELAKGAKIDIF